MTSTSIPQAHWTVGDRGAAHLSLGNRRTVCGTHLGYGNLHTVWPGQRKCQRCLDAEAKTAR